MRMMLSGSMRAQRKMELRKIEVLDSLQAMGVQGAYDYFRTSQADKERFST